MGWIYHLTSPHFPYPMALYLIEAPIALRGEPPLLYAVITQLLMQYFGSIQIYSVELLKAFSASSAFPSAFSLSLGVTIQIRKKMGRVSVSTTQPCIAKYLLSICPTQWKVLHGWDLISERTTKCNLTISCTIISWQLPFPCPGRDEMELQQMGSIDGCWGKNEGNGSREIVGQEWIRAGLFYCGSPPSHLLQSSWGPKMQSGTHFVSIQRRCSYNHASMHQIPPSAPESRIIASTIRATGSPL